MCPAREWCIPRSLIWKKSATRLSRWTARASFTASPTRARSSWQRIWPRPTACSPNLAEWANAWIGYAEPWTPKTAAKNRPTASVKDRENYIRPVTTCGTRSPISGIARARNKNALPPFWRALRLKSRGNNFPAIALAQVRLEQTVDSLVFIQPGIGVGESVPIQWVWREAEIVLVQFDQPLVQAHRIFEQYIVVDDAVTDQQRIL